MKTSSERELLTHTMAAFFHQNSLPAAWRQAMKFAGKGGRLATLPDIAAARLEVKTGKILWERFFTTTTAEYLGFSRRGHRILIIAHGVGPMSTLNGVQKAYGWEYKDKGRNHHGGRITAREFLDLEAGKFGEVTIVDFESYCQLYEYPFRQTFRVSQAINDPVLKARFGPQAEQYFMAHAAAARMWHREQASLCPEYADYDPPNLDDQLFSDCFVHHITHGHQDSDPFIIQLGYAPNCPYILSRQRGYRPIDEGYAIAHLISTGPLWHLQHEDIESLTNMVHCYEWWGSVRVVSITADSSIESVSTSL